MKKYSVTVSVLLFQIGYINKSAKNNIWFQGVKDGEIIWRFHDGSTLPDFLKRDTIESNHPYELHLAYFIDRQQFLDRQATAAHSFICEHC